ncbi:abortive phage resistance protein [Candidatus Magnetomorum sp. HK-1]|nr:abortive phage resistance protein [Candidatus Magnetomorum sp. HK-1]
MSKKRRQFKRPLGQKSYRKLFVIAVEGAKTEPQYFTIFNNQQSIIRIHCLKGAHSSPPYVLKRMLNYLRREDLRKKDEAWLVVDKDQWTDDQLIKLLEWSQKADNYGFALSNPKFEYWLLLHFEDATGIKNSRDCVERLKKYLQCFPSWFLVLFLHRLFWVSPSPHRFMPLIISGHKSF